MRINLNTINYQTSQRALPNYNGNKSPDYNMQPSCINENSYYKKQILPPISYYISFTGDSTVLKEFSAIIKNDVNITAKENNNKKFEDALYTIYEQNPKLYEKVLDKKENFRTISREYNKFSDRVLNSLDEVRNGNKVYMELWQNNAKIGTEKISELIKEITKDTDVNNAIINADDKTYSLVKYKLTESWLKNALKSPQNNKQVPQYNLDYKIGEIHQIFDESSINIIFNPKTSDEDKINAFRFLNNFVLEKLENENGKNLSETFQKLYEISSEIDNKHSYETIGLLKNEIVKFYVLAKQEFDKNHLPQMLEDETNKIRFIKENEKKIPDIRKIPGYQNFNNDQKFFISYYFNNLGKLIHTGKRFKINADDFLRAIISDRNIETPDNIINSISSSVDNIQNNYNYDLDNYYMLLQRSEYNSEVNFPTRIAYNPDDNLSYENLYLQKLNKPQLMFLSAEEQRNFLRTLTEDEFILLNDKIKEDWKRDELPFAMLKQARKYAYNSSIAVNICNELKQVNANLSDIKIKMDNINYSFDKFMQLCPVIKDTDEEIKVNKNSSNIISDLKREYAALSLDEQANFDKAINDYMPSIIDELKKNVDNPQNKEMLDLLKSQCKNNKINKKGSAFLNTLSAIILSKSVCNVGNAGASFISHFAASKGLVSGVSASAETSAAALASSVGTSSASTSSVIPPVDPVIAALFILAVSSAILAKGVHNAKNLEKQQRPLIYTLDYNS